MNTASRKPIVLIVLDGFGLNPMEEGNPMKKAAMPTFDMIIRNYPAVALHAAEQNVGLSFGEMGNSEVGHLALGSGQVVYQSLPRINLAISDKTFFTNEAFLGALHHVEQTQGALHLFGLCSNGGIHGHIDHLHALLQLCKERNISRVFVHAILDGRDTKQDSGLTFLTTLVDIMQSAKVGRIATLSGRTYAMDRNDHWDRIQKAYDAMVSGTGEKAQDPLKAIEASYAKKVFDEQFAPTVISGGDGNPVGPIHDGDAVIFFNFREDRARQITKAFVVDDFSGFERGTKLQNLFFVTMTEYEKGLPTTVAFPPQIITRPLARVISEAGLHQYHLAETEKYAHVTYFFNGGTEEAFPNEVRDLVPSPSVSSYDQKPEMSALAVTKKLVEQIQKKKFDFLLVNYANPDMVGHTGNFEATVAALQVIDDCVRQVIEAANAERGVVFISADHGNCEIMIDPVTGRVSKEHSTSPVPLLMIDEERKREKTEEEVMMFQMNIQPIGLLADVAPTIIELLGLKQPEEMTGKSLLEYLV